MRLLYFGVTTLALMFQGAPASASEVRIDGNRVIVTTDSGKVIDTDNLQKGHEAKDGDGVVVNDNGISIGAVSSGEGEQKNVRRNTTLENVVIINNGKTTVYRKGAGTDKSEKQK